MSMSLRDQLLAAGLINQKQARDAERQREQQQRSQQQRSHQQAVQKKRAESSTPAGSQPAAATSPAGAGSGAGSKPGGGVKAVASPVAVSVPKNASALSAKVARDLALNRQQQEKAQKKAIAAQVRQLVQQNRVSSTVGGDRYNFVDEGKVRFVTVDAALRARLLSGEVAVVRHAGSYDVVPADIAQRIRERDPHAVIDALAPPQGGTLDEAYKDFAVPDDLTW